MTIIRNAVPVATIAAGLLASTVMAGAQGIDGEQVFGQLAAQMQLNGITIDAAEVETRGTDIALSGVGIGFDQQMDPLMLESVLLEDVQAGDDGAFIIGRVAAPAGSTTSDGVTVDFGGAEILGYFVAGPDATDPVLRGNLYDALNVGSLTVSGGQGTIFSMGGASVINGAYVPGGALNYQMEARDIVVEIDNFDDPQAREALSGLGYSSLAGTMTSQGAWDTGSGDLDVDHMTFSVDEAADLTIAFSLGGFTTEMVNAMQQMQVDLAEQGQDAIDMAMLGLMQQLEVNSVAIEVNDNSLTNRILDLVGEQQGLSRQNVVAMAKGALPLGLAQLGAPQFAASASAAVSAFLDDPQSLRIVAEPENPVPVMQLVAAGMSSPQTLITMLGVSITANQ